MPATLPKVAVLTPCRDAASDLDTYFGIVEALDYPKDQLGLFLLEGDSTDDTFLRAERGLKGLNPRFAATKLIKLDFGGGAARHGRTAMSAQRDRRARIAACRNALLAEAVVWGADFVLFIDVDMAVIPPETLKTLIAYNAPILMPNCLRHEGGRVFDLNTFRYTQMPTNRMIRAYSQGGLYQPPAGFFRHYPEQGTRKEIEPVHGVGGTCLLIRQDVLAAGVDFPETPFHHHIETEGLALKAALAGFGAFCLTSTIVRHGPT